MKLKLRLLLVACFFSSNIFSQVIYTDIAPDTTIVFDSAHMSVGGWGYNNEFDIDMDNDGTNDFNLNIHVWLYLGTMGDCEFDISPYGLNEAAVAGTEVLQLNNGDLISNNGNWLSDSSLRLVYRFFDSSGDMCNDKRGLWNLNASHQFIGVKFYKNQTAYFGWIQVSNHIHPVAFTGCEFTVEGYAYEASGGRILAGQGAATGIPDLNSNTSCNIFPNPVSQRATVNISKSDFKNNTHLNFEITDVAGKRVALYENVDRSFELNRQGIRNGLYFYRLINDTHVVKTGKMVFN
jgi:hypothetical protein